MNIYAISDLHLAGNQKKDMDIFGKDWHGHFEKICTYWQDVVQQNDIVLITGDISWAMRFEDGISDLKKISALKGKKIFIKGNHDYWWLKINAIRALFQNENCYFLQNDCVEIEDYIFCGSRGWTCPDASIPFTVQDKKIYQREGERFKLAFKQVNQIRKNGQKLIALIHYPPFNSRKEESIFTKLFEENQVDAVVFGHIHQYLGEYLLEEVKNNIPYYLTSCDLLQFKLKKIM